jgi:hypothetical protein
MDQAAHRIGHDLAAARTITLTTAVSAAAAAAVKCPSAGCDLDPAKISLTGIDLGQAVVAILAVFAISGEYSTGMIRVSLAAVYLHISARSAAKECVLAQDEGDLVHASVGGPAHDAAVFQRTHG